MPQSKIPKDNPASRFGDKVSPGRPKGIPNKNTGLLKDAIIMAATNIGNKLSGTGLVGYLEDLQANHPPVFAQLVGKVLPLQLVGEFAHKVTISELSDDELAGIAMIAQRDKDKDAHIVN
jgi:hypothetical protein